MTCATGRARATAELAYAGFRDLKQNWVLAK